MSDDDLDYTPKSDIKPPTFWQAIWLLVTGFVLGTADDVRRMADNAVEVFDYGMDFMIALLKLVSRWLIILIGPISFPLIAWYVLAVNRANVKKLEAEKKRLEDLMCKEKS